MDTVEFEGEVYELVDDIFSPTYSTASTMGWIGERSKKPRAARPGGIWKEVKHVPGETWYKYENPKHSEWLFIHCSHNSQVDFVYRKI